MLPKENKIDAPIYIINYSRLRFARLYISALLMTPERCHSDQSTPAMIVTITEIQIL
jgi:hypothetical protein